MISDVRCCLFVTVGSNSVPKTTVFCDANLCDIWKFIEVSEGRTFYQNVGDFLQNYKALRFLNDFYSEHDKNINGGIFFEVNVCLYYRIEIISVVKQNKVHNVFGVWNMALETEVVHVPGRGISK
jgi:hypothetical protein